MSEDTWEQVCVWGGVPCFLSCRMAGHFLDSLGSCGPCRESLPSCFCLNPLVPSSSPLLWLKRAFWDTCLGTFQGPGTPRHTVTHISACLFESSVCLWVGLRATLVCVRPRRGAHPCAVSMGF